MAAPSPLAATPELCSLLLLLISSAIVYSGAHAALHRPQNALPADNDDEDSISEMLSLRDAYWFPFASGAVLTFLYVLLSLVDKEMLNLILTLYFCLLGLPMLSTTLADSFGLLLSSPPRKIALSTRGNPSRSLAALLQFKFNERHLFTMPLAFALCLAYFYSKHWLLSDILAIGIAYSAFSLMKLSDFKTGVVLLSGLFFYDIFFVFGSPIMLAVATGLDIPIKLSWPKSSGDYGILGLGDIVLPGIFVALSLRFDAFLYHSRHPKLSFNKSAFPKSYFITCFTAYIAGLTVTVLVMHFFKSAQPALLYLSPSCIISVSFLAWYRGDIKAMFAYSEDNNDSRKLTKASTNKAADAKIPETPRRVLRSMKSLDLVDGIGHSEWVQK
ncbi:Minor histocompatibility antigen H13 [Neolecta irregularis DAH-3]|uniref:Minor histocompatibility antigen H13 n=1 Tax=Neolecta irregularis (strain DAH-3) TaxID=1198029 RepID=A0A1U7LKX7_NEOID|nr:Minor histocompatibility antigen H13 [Neolecta irregularis DAH-3]|eukprot:OLL23310.1 Minor histocompatibility antigen H13 [Neolecta irregularis DAH-3]